MSEDMIYPQIETHELYDHLDEEDPRVRAIVAARKREELALVGDVLDTYQGRALFAMLWEVGGLNRNPFAGEDHATTGFNCGMQGMAQWASELVFTVAPEQYNIIRREARQRQEHFAELVGKTETVEE
jgi:hypothetical protein